MVRSAWPHSFRTCRRLPQGVRYAVIPHMCAQAVRRRLQQGLCVRSIVVPIDALKWFLELRRTVLPYRLICNSVSNDRRPEMTSNLGGLACPSRRESNASRIRSCHQTDGVQ